MGAKQVTNLTRAYNFFKEVPYNTDGQIEQLLTADGFVNSIRVRFATGENGTLFLRPVIIINPDIIIDLFRFGSGADRWISGDSETISIDLHYEIEANSRLVVFYKNTAENPETVPSRVDVNVGVTYYSMVEPEGIIGQRSRQFWQALKRGW